MFPGRRAVHHPYMLDIVFVVVHAVDSSEAAPLGAACLVASIRADPELAAAVSTRILEYGPETTPGRIARDLSERRRSAEADPGAGAGVDACAVAAPGTGEGAGAIVATDAGAGAGAKRRAVGFSLFSWNRKTVLEVCGILAAGGTRPFLFAGGPEATACAADLSASGVFDCVVAGEGELAVRELARALLEGSGTIPAVLRTGPLEASDLVSPWTTSLLEPPRGGGVLWELARGCPFSCAYCYEGSAPGGVRYLPEERLKAELDRFVGAGVDHAYVLDPTFNSDRPRTARILRLLAERGRGIRYRFEIRAEFLDRAQAGLFGELDCSVQIGLQSARPDVLEAVGRSVDPGAFARRCALLDGAGVPFGLDLIYGLPGDSLDGFAGSLDFALGLAPNHLDIFPLSVLPGTRLARDAVRYGLDFDPAAPYILRSSPGFPAGDMARASALASACDLFYSRGRAVSWFLRICEALALRPSGLLDRFARWLSGRSVPAGPGNAGILPLQTAFLGELFGELRRGDRRLSSVALDLVRFESAWSRALAEGETTVLDLVADPGILCGASLERVSRLVAGSTGTGVRIRVAPGRDGVPVVRREVGRSRPRPAANPRRTPGSDPSVPPSAPASTGPGSRTPGTPSPGSSRTGADAAGGSRGHRRPPGRSSHSQSGRRR